MMLQKGTTVAVAYGDHKALSAIPLGDIGKDVTGHSIAHAEKATGS